MYRRILVAVDESATSQRAAREAIALAQATEASLLFVHVGDDPVHAERVLEPLMTIARQARTASEREVLSAGSWDVASRIRGEAARWGADLIVVGTHGRHGLARMIFGSVSGDVASGADIPVLVVPGVSLGAAIA